MTRPTASIVAGERGAILIQTALASFVLFGLAAFVIDYGMFWVSRTQAQNAADAAAISGALARAYDEPGTPSAGGPTDESARAVAALNTVWFEAPAADVTFDCPPAATGDCVTVDVFRDTAHGNALPAMFGPLLGFSSQGVQATATASATNGNATDCLRPWAIPDRWTESNPSASTWTSDDEFYRYVPSAPIGTLQPLPIDEYIAPTSSDPGTGLTISDDPAMGLEFSPLSPVRPGRIQPLTLPGGGLYADNIASCSGQLVKIGDDIPINTAATVGETATGLLDLVAEDPAANWDTVEKKITGSCAPACAPVSPRLVAVALFDVDRYASMLAANDWSGCPGGFPCVRVVNIAGVFIDAATGLAQASTFLTRYPGITFDTSPTVDEGSSFLKAVTLVR